MAWKVLWPIYSSILNGQGFLHFVETLPAQMMHLAHERHKE